MMLKTCTKTPLKLGLKCFSRWSFIVQANLSILFSLEFCRLPRICVGNDSNLSLPHRRWYLGWSWVKWLCSMHYNLKLNNRFFALVSSKFNQLWFSKWEGENFHITYDGYEDLKNSCIESFNLIIKMLSIYIPISNLHECS